MPYRYLDDMTKADLAFEATGSTPEQLFADAWEAALRVMIEEPSALQPRERRTVSLENDSLEFLLVDFLQEMLFYKDAEGLLLRLTRCRVWQADGQHHVQAEAAGERAAAERHSLGTDVKAVTYHHLGVERHTGGGWKATVILDV